jgi:VWFA-related protein
VLLNLLHRQRLTAWLLLLGVSPAAAQQEQPEDPLDLEVEERIEVRLVTVDVLVTDRDGAAVPGLGREDFELQVDGEAVPVDTLDETCSTGFVEEPRARRGGDWPEGPDLAEGTRRIVLAFDYLHLRGLTLTDTYERLRDALATKKAADGVRVEQPFTRSRKQILAALKRMEYDITLWNGMFEHLNEMRLFDNLEALATVLGQFDGPKSVVLFTKGRGPGDLYEPRFQELASLSSESRVAFYPVDCMGLEPPRFT